MAAENRRQRNAWREENIEAWRQRLKSGIGAKIAAGGKAA
jgi:hypothetical protein